MNVGGTNNPQAYDAYLRPLRFYHDSDTDNAKLQASLAAVDEAIALDRDYAAPYALRAYALIWLSFGISDLRAISDARQKAVAAAERAVALAPN